MTDNNAILAAGDPDTAERFLELVKRTNTDEAAADDVRALREMLEEHPGLWRFAGDLAQTAMQNLLEATGGPSVFRASLEQGVGELKEELGHGQASALERLLIDQVVVCWLRLSHFENQMAVVLQQQTFPERALKFWEGRVSAAQRQYLRAMKTLAQVRKLASQTPSLTQINIDARRVGMEDG